MTISVTPIFIPGLILTRDIFAAQIDGLVHSTAAKAADTLGQDSITSMAEAALALADGPLVPVGISMGGYIAMEMARLAPQRLAGIALLNTQHRA